MSRLTRRHTEYVTKAEWQGALELRVFPLIWKAIEIFISCEFNLHHPTINGQTPFVI